VETWSDAQPKILYAVWAFVKADKNQVGCCHGLKHSERQLKVEDPIARVAVRERFPDCKIDENRCDKRVENGR
jgi:hypothetical protein